VAAPIYLTTRVLEAGAQPVSAASLAVFRIAFGLLMVVNVFLYLFHSLVHEYYIGTAVNFPYGRFTFLAPLPGAGMYLVYWAMAVTGVLIAIGLWYRWSAAAFFVLTTYVFLLDSTYYQNHEYLISLVAFLMILLPADRIWSIDALRRRRPDPPTVPAWVVWLLRFQIGVPYFFGGIAKLDAGWFRGEPLRMWLARRTDIEVIGPLLGTEPVLWIMVYGGLLFDLFIVFFLLHRRTRIPAFIVATLFHVTNARLFGLFIFPWLMIAATTIFFPPDWPERVWAWWGSRRKRQAGGLPAAPVAGGSTPRVPEASRMRPALVLFLAAWVLIQLVVPLRHHAVEGSPNWTEQGHRFSWHMKLRSKQGTATFIVSDGHQTWRVDPADHLSSQQIARLAGHPDRLVQFSRYLSDLHDGAEVRAETAVSLNGRRRAPIVDPDVDLSSVRVVWWRSADWILPLEEPLRHD
jgi:vitamin K-dependent gamma-carboxylase